MSHSGGCEHKEKAIGLSKEYLIKTATAQLRRKTLAALSVRNLAASCSVPPSAFYYYFQSKQDLVAECMAHYAEGFLGELRVSKCPIGAQGIRHFAHLLHSGLINNELCLGMILSAQCYELAEEINSEIVIFNNDCMSYLERMWVYGLKDGSIASALCKSSAAQLIFTSLGGMLVSSRLYSDGAQRFSYASEVLFDSIGVTQTH